MKHYTQRTDNDCMLACIATAVQQDYDALFVPDWLDRVIKERGATSAFAQEALEHAGLKHRVDFWQLHLDSNLLSVDHFHNLFKGRRAIFSVPSLNHQHGRHAVCWMYDHLHDPNPEHKQRYRWLDQLFPNAVTLFNELPTPAQTV